MRACESAYAPPTGRASAHAHEACITLPRQSDRNASHAGGDYVHGFYRPAERSGTRQSQPVSSLLV